MSCHILLLMMTFENVEIEAIKRIQNAEDLIFMQIGAITDFSWIFQFVFLAFIILMSLYGAKFQIWQMLKQIEVGLVEMKRMFVESRQTAIKTFKEYGHSEEEVAEELDQFMDYFTIMPVDLDPAGILKRLDHLLDVRRDRFQEFVADLAPESSGSMNQNLENTLEVTQVLGLIYRLVRHFYILGKKTGSQMTVMQIHMLMPELLLLAKAYFDAIGAFSQGKPIGDGIGPLVITKFAREFGATPESYTHEISKEVGYYTVEAEGRTIYALRATGPGGTVGKPGFGVKNLMEKHGKKISRIITIDAALKFEGEEIGRVAEGTGAAIGDPGPEKYAMEQAATEHGIGIEAIVIKEDEAAAVGVMDKKILDTVPEVIERIKSVILKRTKPGESIILAGIGNTIGIGL